MIFYDFLNAYFSQFIICLLFYYVSQIIHFLFYLFTKKKLLNIKSIEQNMHRHTLTHFQMLNNPILY